MREVTRRLRSGEKLARRMAAAQVYERCKCGNTFEQKRAGVRGRKLKWCDACRRSGARREKVNNERLSKGE